MAEDTSRRLLGGRNQPPSETVGVQSQADIDRLIQSQLQQQNLGGGLGQFQQALNEFNPQFFDVGGQLLQRGLSGEEDPLIAQQRQAATEQQRGALTRAGVGGSVGLNQQNRLGQQFNQASLARNDQLIQSGFGLQQSGLQNLLALPALQTARIAAERSGQGGGGGGGGKKGGK